MLTCWLLRRAIAHRHAISARLAAARSAIGWAVHLGSRLLILEDSLQAAENGARLEGSRFARKASSGIDYDCLLLDRGQHDAARA
jgi:hypothetical protein